MLKLIRQEQKTYLHFFLITSSRPTTIYMRSHRILGEWGISQRVMCSLSNPSQVSPRDHLLARAAVIVPHPTAAVLHVKYKYGDIGLGNDRSQICALHHSQILTQYTSWQ